MSRNSCQNIMEQIHEEDLSRVAHYFLPNHVVLRPDSTTTKLRVVFAGSCTTSSSISLNDGLMVGPVIPDDLISIHTQFRLHRIGIVADVAKMHRTIKLCSCDQKLLLILWMTNADKPIEAFQPTTIIFSTYTRSSSAENGETSRLSVGAITRFLHWRHDHWR